MFNLDYPNPSIIECYSEHFLIGAYPQNNFLLDLYVPSGIKTHKCRIDVRIPFKNLTSDSIKTISKAIFPRLKWSDRQFE